jgi:hypothetical protein
MLDVDLLCLAKKWKFYCGKKSKRLKILKNNVVFKRYDLVWIWYGTNLKSSCEVASQRSLSYKV